MNRRIPWSTVILVAVAAFCAAVVLYENLGTAADRAEKIERDKLLVDIAKMEDISKAFVAVASALKPSVVSITTISKPVNFPFTNDPRFKRFYGRIPGKEGAGSGVIVSEDGYILTNNHVVRGGDMINVKLADKREFKASVVGTDAKTDLALLKINAEGLIPAPLGDSDSLRPGQWVIAIGKPFGLEQTVTAGIVSALHRSKVGVADYENFIQTDVSLNPGSSGGPLINLKGKVVGLNTAIATATRSDRYQGIGFAIPMNLAKRVMDKLKAEGRVRRAYMGVFIADIDDVPDGVIEASGFKEGGGAYITDIVPDGPAEKAGFKKGDIVIELNGKKVATKDQFRNLISTSEIGEEVTMKVFRGGSELTLKVTLASLEDADILPRRLTPQPPKILTPPQPRRKHSTTTRVRKPIGVGIDDITPGLAKKTGISVGGGVYVGDVLAGSFAEDRGIKVGDVILEVNGRKTGNSDKFALAIRMAASAKSISFMIARKGSTLQIHSAW
ncbi:MAG: PDZ domain-containing protein [Planctomycetota bacterium]|nr:MAG: PDZ domain-containing protein [Planctomycetota bacterium]